MSDANRDLVTEFCNTLLAADTAKLVAYLSEDVHYHNMPWKPVSGRAAVREVLSPLVDGENCAITKMVIHHTVAEGDVVMNARTETWERAGVRVELPVAGVFEVQDGLITRWLDYWDLPTLQPLLDTL